MEQITGFCGDHFLKESFKELIEKWNPDLIIETGTHRGDTTKQLLDMSKCEVMTFEVNNKFFREAMHKLITDETKHRLHMAKANSGEALESEVQKLYISKPMRCIFFLDAHWYNYNPLHDELKQIARLYKQKVIKAPIIVVHDMKNPLDESMKYDEYPGIIYDWEYIQPIVHGQVYKHTTYRRWYNEEAAGARCGCLFLEPIKS